MKGVPSVWWPGSSRARAPDAEGAIMAKKLTPQQRKFKKASKASMDTCHRETKSTKTFGKCMSREMKKRLRKKR